MQFTYKAYENLICNLYNNGYQIKDYHNYFECDECAILRHDIDYDLERAVNLSKIEKDNGVKSTYFILLTSDFYNPVSKASLKVFDKLRKHGHEIGLHFDEVHYQKKDVKWNQNEIIENILKEVELLGKIIGEPVKVVSMHRPSRQTLESNLEIPGIINSYSNEFFKDFKYVSDSRMRWREDIEKMVTNKEYHRLHILTHSFWYGEEQSELKEILNTFIMDASKDRYEILNRNFTNLNGALADGRNVVNSYCL